LCRVARWFIFKPKSQFWEKKFWMVFKWKVLV
jgi:hypothetical protein